MLLTHRTWAEFTAKPVADRRRESAPMLAFCLPCRAAVDPLMAHVFGAGGVEPRAEKDHGLMCGRAFEDTDGHIREPFRFDAARPDTGP
jgi:predicted lactoylglutathione lyase